jgi:MinD-like ATPase involved in chromosome partitioning or flagellar assembly/CheY-like chemotaxis protein
MDETVVLIIDPDATSNQLLSQLIRKLGYKVFSSQNGTDGLMKVNDFLPAAIICDTSLPDISSLDLIQRLQRDRRLAYSPVIAVSNRYNAEEMEVCLKSGYSEYFAKSGAAALSLAESLPRLISERAAKAKQDDRGLLIAFLSAKGGVGTSSLCANIAHALGVVLQPATVGLMDMVLPMGSLTSITGYEGPCNLRDMVQRLDGGTSLPDLRDCMPVPQGWSFHYLPGAHDPEVASRLPLDRLPDIMTAMRSLFNYVVVDFGRMLSRKILPIIREADVLALVVGTDFDAVELTTRLLKYLSANGVKAERFYPILNRAVGLQGMTKAQIDSALGIEVRLTIPYLMDSLALANNMHIPYITKYPTETVSVELNQLASDISRLALKSRMGEE